MRARIAAAAAVLVAGLAGTTQQAAHAAPTPATAATAAHACGQATPGHVRCLVVAPRSTAAPLAAGGPPAGYAPADLQAAYSLPSTLGAGQTIAVVDAFDDPSAESDLATYRQTFGLPPCTTADGCLRKLDQRGGTDFPPADASWALETSLDLDMVSAACPLCHIVLVEADSTALDAVAAAEDTAAAQHVAAISNSFGAPEFTGMDRYAPHFHHAGTTTVVSSGDLGFTTASFPAVLPDVIAVGGTSLSRAVNARGFTETAWSGAGSGCSAWIAKPAWQKDRHCHMRTVADVAAVADPATGVAVYDSVPFQGRSGWFEVGGTSAAAPLVAGVVGLAGNGAALDPSYVYAHARSLHDVVAGSNVAAWDCGGDYICTARRGYDGPTGLGTPDGTGAF